MSQIIQLSTRKFIRFSHLCWFCCFMLSVLLTSGCGGVPVELKSVEEVPPAEEVSPAEKQEVIQQEKDVSEPDIAEPGRAEPEVATAIAERPLLVLYKSSEGDTAEGNIFVYHLQEFALSQKYNPMYHDIDDSFPSDAMMKNIDVIVTAYNGPIMKNTRGYIEWMTRQVSENKKILIIGNFGAFSADGNEWLDGTVLNPFYHAIGLEFAGHWTNDPKLIQVGYKDDDMIGYETDITPSMLTHYFMIKSLHPDNIIYLSLKRNDLDDSESAVVVKTHAGCLAMENYVFSQVGGQTKKLLNLEKYFAECVQ